MNNEFLNKDLVLIDKPATWTSFDAVNFIRSSLYHTNGIKNVKVGHTGTLDPFATGLLLVAIGRENTKKIDQFAHLDKTYVATLELGATSDTFDSTGTIIKNPEAKPIDLSEIEKALKSFIGPQDQLPPMFSAKKVNGQRLYKLARKGREVEREPSHITIFDIKLLDYSYPQLSIEVHSSAGTYIRTLADDIGRTLGVGAYCCALRRTKIGEYSINKAIKIKPKTAGLSRKNRHTQNWFKLTFWKICAMIKPLK
ncbi:MAG: tRNA pseudouridine(55) synthase TruB [Candidatus Magasanikbacteria bacterium]|nr:tRNA pseudouridine(55) synthase TruB [Candidatus Magasanikbacteria bacterium]